MSSRTPPPTMARLPTTPRDLPPRPGVTLLEDGIDVAVYAGHADGVDLCLFAAGDSSSTSEQRVPLTERAHGWWFATVPGIGRGQRYGFRVEGTWEPSQGMRHNPAKLLLDPYAKAIEGGLTYDPAVYGHVVDAQLRGDDELRSDTDSAPFVPRSVVVDDAFDWSGDTPPERTYSETVVYETHVRNLTMRHPEVPERLRGTYAGVAHPAVLRHLRSIGVTAVELLPVQAFVSEPDVARRGLVNHWGYNTLGFFAPHARYAAARDPQGVLDEFKGMVRRLHAEGIEVILDVVYNHTCEQSRTGATLAWRGLDNRAYYRLDARGRDIDVTGCGNTLDLRHPVVCRMVLDSLRYWVTECHVDGFRFDLAVALARGRGDDYDPDHPFLVALRTDPVLSRVKLIAEPWDLGIHGWRTGQFPPPFAEWNDRFRDTVRTFWLPGVATDLAGLSAQQGHGVHDLATRITGSDDLFRAHDRGPIASVNFVAAHDGFPAADLTAYDVKHNGANGEGNRDGSDSNRSWNHGVEGPTDSPTIRADRRRSIRNLLGTLLLSTGVPMLCGGDELGRTQQGNNNAYCQDNEISWVDWDLAEWQEDLLETVRFLAGMRREHPVLRQRSFFTGRPAHPDGTRDLDWFDGDGAPMGAGWGLGSTRTLQALLDGRVVGNSTLLVVLHGGADPRTVTLPPLPGGCTAYRLVWDSTWERPATDGGPRVEGRLEVGPASLCLLLGEAPAPPAPESR